MYPVYPKKETYGKSEEIIGDWLKIKKNRSKMIIGTKVASNHPTGIGATKLSWVRGGGETLRFDKKILIVRLREALRDSKLTI